MSLTNSDEFFVAPTNLFTIGDVESFVAQLCDEIYAKNRQMLAKYTGKHPLQQSSSVFIYIKS